MIFFGVLLTLLFTITEIILPQLLTGMLREQIVRLTASDAVSLSLDSSPRFMIATGRVDEIRCEVAHGKLGELEADSLSLNGDNIQVDMPAILFDIKEGNRKIDVETVLKSVGNVEMRGIITEENLKAFLTKKFSQIEQLELKITPETINAIASARVFGRAADVDLDGVVLADGGNLYFRATKLNIHNALLRQIQLDNFFTDMKIVDAEQLPLNLRFTNVELQEGQAIITAIRNAQ